jgi:hypothetical protein
MQQPHCKRGKRRVAGSEGYLVRGYSHEEGVQEMAHRAPLERMATDDYKHRDHCWLFLLVCSSFFFLIVSISLLLFFLVWGKLGCDNEVWSVAQEASVEGMMDGVGG